ncbi:hypothetical protein C8F01DRAFT_1173529 [Mycena amicta]|nr:hypothetical protein C8F01DRAFT_1173529 [Mycena amicta]
MVDQCIHKARVCHTKQLCKIGREDVLLLNHIILPLSKVQPFICHNRKWLCGGKYLGMINHLLSDHDSLDTSSASGTALNNCGLADHVSQTYGTPLDTMELIFILLLITNHLGLTTVLLDDLIEYAPSNGDIIDIVEEGGSICPLDVLGRCRWLPGPSSGQLDARRTVLG